MANLNSEPIRVVVIDDTPAVRELLTEALENADGIQVVGSGVDGIEAVQLAKRLRPDVITMDVVMPRMDGLEATQHIMREAPTRIIIVTAGLMRAEEDLTFLALQFGALTVIRRPGLADPETTRKVIDNVRLMASVPVVHHWGREKKEDTPKSGLPSPATIASLPIPETAEPRHVQIIGMAASTGGPGTLATVLRSLPADFPIPILVVQHITQGFVTGMAEWLDTETPLKVGLAGHGDRPPAGTVLLAPDDYHMQVNARGMIELLKEEPYKGLRPSANYLFRSLARAYGSRAVGVILTGMGDDGIEGLQRLRRAGGLTLAQDEESCVVFGMPQEAVRLQAVDRVLNPSQISVSLNQLAT